MREHFAIGRNKFRLAQELAFFNKEGQADFLGSGGGNERVSRRAGAAVAAGQHGVGWRGLGGEVEARGARELARWGGVRRCEVQLW